MCATSTHSSLASLQGRPHVWIRSSEACWKRRTTRWRMVIAVSWVPYAKADSLTAGIRRADIAGSGTSVHVGSFCNGEFSHQWGRSKRTSNASALLDYTTYVLRDEQQIPVYNATGCSQTLLSNRISWAFDLRGTSVTVDTACSSGLVALDLACQEIWTGRSSTAICAASNVILAPENLITLSNM